MTEGSRYVSTLPGVSAGSAVHCRPCRSLKYGDLWIGRDVATAIKNQLSEGAFTVSIIAALQFDFITCNI